MVNLVADLKPALPHPPPPPRSTEAQAAVQAAAIRSKIGKVGVDEGALAEALVEVSAGRLVG